MKLENGLEQYYLELDTLMTEFRESRLWEVMKEGLKQERRNALEVGLYDEELPAKYYQGYIRAIEYLIQLPERIQDAAEEIRREQDEQDNVESVRKNVERQYAGGGEVA